MDSPSPPIFIVPNEENTTHRRVCGATKIITKRGRIKLLSLVRKVRSFLYWNISLSHRWRPFPFLDRPIVESQVNSCFPSHRVTIWTQTVEGPPGIPESMELDRDQPVLGKVRLSRAPSTPPDQAQSFTDIGWTWDAHSRTGLS